MFQGGWGIYNAVGLANPLELELTSGFGLHSRNMLQWAGLLCPSHSPLVMNPTNAEISASFTGTGMSV